MTGGASAGGPGRELWPADLVYDGFVADIHTDRLADYPRYLDAIDQRLDALELDPRRDVQRQAE
ncbi:MAG: DUF3418 domain-containing protein, partial [Trueperaceae bacterium]|nr:DUF3418 domain-containing protein [Trueperaceae bacterium]